MNGRIPAGEPCPYNKGCGLKTDNCPVEGHTKLVDFSCALARLFAMKEGVTT